MLHSTVCTCGAVHVHPLTLDRAKPSPGLIRARKLEEHYSAQLRKIARQVGLIVKAWAPEDGAFDLSQVPELEHTLGRYAEVITPWARSTAERIGAEIAIKERRFWAEHAKAMSRSLRDELMNAPTGQALRDFLGEQVRLIRSLPIEAGERVHDLTLKGLETSGRASEIAREIMRSGEVAESRAKTIARTEVSRTASGLVMVRSLHVGATTYAWRTSRDPDVRPSHEKMEGKIVAWDKPPTLDGMTGHAGMLPNCRCYPEPILPDF